MKITQRLMERLKGRFVRKVGKDEQFYCSETNCQSIKIKKASINDKIPAQENCSNISNCHL